MASGILRVPALASPGRASFFRRWFIFVCQSFVMSRKKKIKKSHFCIANLNAIWYNRLRNSGYGTPLIQERCWLCLRTKSCLVVFVVVIFPSRVIPVMRLFVVCLRIILYTFVLVLLSVIPLIYGSVASVMAPIVKSQIPAKPQTTNTKTKG